MTAEEFKAQGNKAFASGDFQTAIDLFSKAIELDSTNHVLYSNRSAAYCSLKDYKSASADAEKTVQLKPDWAKGYSRKGAALYGMGDYFAAAEAYQEGLKIEPNNQLLKKGLADAEQARAQDFTSGLGNVFGPDMFSKMAQNPRLAPFLAQPDLMEKLLDCQKDPKNMNKYMNDQRMMQVMIGLMGIDAQVATNDEELERAKEKANEDLERRREEEAAKKKVPEPEPEPEISQDELDQKQKREKSDAEKNLGNQFYKKRQFEQALSHYDAAWELDSTNVAVLTNKAAVLFEMERFEECIKVCETAVDTGREIRADFKLIGRALGRIGSAYQKLEDFDNAIKFFNKSLAEHRTADILTKLRETEQIKEQKAKLAYINPEISNQEREKGNEFFKKNAFPEAVKCYTEAIRRNPDDARNFSNRAACYTKLMALPEAEKDCNEAIRLDPAFIKAYIRKAAVQFAKKDFTKCIETCQEALAKDTEGKHANEIQGQVKRVNVDL
jgi:stress-induced-phosphoprotein 1